VITGAQIRQARELLGWTRYRLAPRADMSHRLLAQFENGRAIDQDSAERLRAALEAEGIEFLANGSGDGVRLRAFNGTPIKVENGRTLGECK
jgi:transcriptional regulator with XRE-family HTH domain